MEREVRVPIEEVRQEECPVSIISRNGGMDALVTEIFNMYRVKESTGAILFGSDTGKWPSRWYDAVRLAEIEESRVDEAKDEVRDRERPR